MRLLSGRVFCPVPVRMSSGGFFRQGDADIEDRAAFLVQDGEPGQAVRGTQRRGRFFQALLHTAFYGFGRG